MVTSVTSLTSVSKHMTRVIVTDICSNNYVVLVSSLQSFQSLAPIYGGIGGVLSNVFEGPRDTQSILQTLVSRQVVTSVSLRVIRVTVAFIVLRRPERVYIFSGLEEVDVLLPSVYGSKSFIRSTWIRSSSPLVRMACLVTFPALHTAHAYSLFKALWVFRSRIAGIIAGMPIHAFHVRLWISPSLLSSKLLLFLY